MNENLANEIRKTIESVKDMKIQVGGINNYLSILEGRVRDDYQKQVDDAYQRGYDKGYADKTNNDKVGKELAKDIYQRGLNDAWEAARKIVVNTNNGGIASHTLRKIFGTQNFSIIMRANTAQEVIAKLKAYEEQKADDEIKVGDEVEVLNSGSKYLIAWISGTSLCGFAHDGVTCRLQPSDVRKTGRHFDIAKILGEMKA